MASISPAYDSIKGYKHLLASKKGGTLALIEKDNPDCRNLYAHLPMV